MQRGIEVDKNFKMYRVAGEGLHFGKRIDIELAEICISSFYLPSFFFSYTV